MPKKGGYNFITPYWVYPLSRHMFDILCRLKLEKINVNVSVLIEFLLPEIKVGCVWIV